MEWTVNKQMKQLFLITSNILLCFIGYYLLDFFRVVPLISSLSVTHAIPKLFVAHLVFVTYSYTCFSINYFMTVRWIKQWKATGVVISSLISMALYMVGVFVSLNTMEQKGAKQLNILKKNSVGNLLMLITIIVIFFIGLVFGLYSTIFIKGFFTSSSTTFHSKLTGFSLLFIYFYSSVSLSYLFVRNKNGFQKMMVTICTFLVCLGAVFLGGLIR